MIVMTKLTEIEPDDAVKNVADRLKKIEEIKPPEWAEYVKTGVSRQRPPQQKDWWYIRAASILRKIYLKQNLGVSKLRKEYSGRKNRGHKPEHRFRASGSIIRKILQQLEKAGFVKTEKGKGRKLTPKGAAFLKETAEANKS
jgi:small subunit ribosomal protein S19e